MKNLTLCILLAISPFALAHNCPNEMKAIDAKMSMANLSPTDLTKVKGLREEGEKQHKAGNHGESMKALGEAKKILGI